MIDVSNISAYLAEDKKQQPVVIVKVGTVYYASKSFGNGSGSSAANAKGTIVQASSLQYVSKNNNSASVNSYQVSIADYDGVLKGLIDSSNPYRLPCEVYYGFINALNAPITILVFSGDLALPIKWDEETYEVSFNIESRIEDGTVGDSFPDDTIPESLIGQPWPMNFGSTVRVPAVRITNLSAGEIQQPIVATMFGGASNPRVAVSGWDSFVQGTSLNLLINNIPFTGTFADGYLEITDTTDGHLAAEYEDVAIATRSDTNKTIIYISAAAYAAGIRLQEKWCRIGDYVGYCVKQEGTKCMFGTPWPEAYASGVIDEVSKYGLNSWGYKKVGSGLEDNNSPYHRFFSYLDYRFIHFSDDYSVPSGSKVLLASQETKYLVNILPSDSVVEVLANRTMDSDTKLCLVPSSYFTVNLNDAGQTTLTFIKPLSSYDEEGWSDEIFASSKSTVGGTVADVIEYLLDTYSDLVPEATSFAAVATTLANFQCNFQLLSNDNVLSVCERLAEEANCALIYSTDGVRIKFLQPEPDADLTADFTRRRNNTLSVTSGDNSELFTRVIMEWGLDKTNKPNKIKQENNLAEYGLHEVKLSNMIYNHKDAVESVTNFKAKRLGNIWKQYTFSTTLENFGLEVFDCISDGTIKYIVQAVEVDLMQGIINLTLNTPIKLGATAKSADYWPTPWDISAQTDPLDNREALPDFVPEVLEDGKAKYNPRGSRVNEDDHEPKLKPLNMYLGVVAGFDTEKDNFINVHLFDEEGTLLEGIINVRCMLSEVTSVEEAYPLLTSGDYVLVAGKAVYTEDAEVVEDYFVVDVFHVGGGAGSVYATVTTAPSSTGNSWYVVNTDISIKKIYAYGNADTDMRDWLPRFEVGDRIKIKVVDATYYIDETMTYVGHATRSLSYNETDDRAMAVFA